MSRLNLENGILTSPVLFGARRGTVRQTLTGTFTIPSDGPTAYFLDPGGSDRTVRLPVLAAAGGQEIHVTNLGATNLLNVVDSSGVAVASVRGTQVGIFASYPGNWRVLIGSDSATTTETPYFRQRVIAGVSSETLTAADVGYMVYVDTYNSGASVGSTTLTLPTTLTTADEGAVIGIMKYPESSGSINGHAGQVIVTDGVFTHYLNTPYKTGHYQWSGTKWRLMSPDLQSLRGNHATIHRTISSTPFSADFHRDQGAVLRVATNVTNSDIRVDLPLISNTTVPGAEYMTSDAWIQKTGINNYKATFVPQNGESIDDIAFVSFYNNYGQGTISLTHHGDTLHFESDGNQWHILGGRLATDGLVKNALVNSAFKRWDGSTSATSRSDGAQFAPFWNVLTQTASVQLSRMDNPFDGARYAARATQNQAAAQRLGFVQWIKGPDSGHRRGACHIFGAKMRSNVAGTVVRYAILSWTGTEDAPTVDVVNDWTSTTYSAGNFFLGANLVVSQHGFMNLITQDTWYDLVPLHGQLSSSLNNVMLLVWSESALAQNTTLDIATPMLTPGGVPRMHRDENFADEFQADGPITIAKSAIPITYTGATGESAMVTIPIPANLPGPNGRVEVFPIWSNNNSGNNKVMRVRFGASGAGTGGTAFYAQTNTTNVGVAALVGWANRNSASSQIAVNSITTGNGLGATAAAIPTSAVNTGAASEVVISGDLANSGDTITLEAYRVVVFPGR